MLFSSKAFCVCLSAFQNFLASGVLVPDDPGYILHQSQTLTPPVAWHNNGAAVEYGVYEPVPGTYDGVETVTFRIGWLFKTPYDEGGAVKRAEQFDWHAALRLVVKALNEKRIQLGEEDSLKTVRFEGHYIFLEDKNVEIEYENENELWQMICQSIADNIKPKVVYFRGWEYQLAHQFFDQANIISFAYEGAGVSRDDHKTTMGYDISIPNLGWSKQFFTQVKFKSQDHPELLKVAVISIDDGWHGSMREDARKVAEEMNMDVVFEGKIPGAKAIWAAKEKDPATGLYPEPEDLDWWKDLAVNVFNSGANTVAYTGGYDVMSLLRAIEVLSLNFGAIYSWWASRDATVATLLPSAYQHTFTERRTIEQLDASDVLFGTVKDYRDAMLREFSINGGNDRDSFIATIGSVLYALITETQSIDQAVLNARIPFLSILSSLVGTVKFGVEIYNNGDLPQLTQFGGDPLAKNTVVPAQYAQQALRLPMPSWACRLNDTCTCPPGKYALPKAHKCFECPIGKFGASEGQDRCDACPIGTFSNTSGNSKCEPCGQGTFRGFGLSSTQCVDCVPGTVANKVGATACDNCDYGSFQEHAGASACVLCGEDRESFNLHRTLRFSGESWIPFQGATSSESCRCAVGARMDIDGECRMCSEGMDCIDGKNADSQAGYMTLASAPLEPYLCAPKELCPGGPPQSCKGKFQGIACAICPAGMFNIDGECKECDGGSNAWGWLLWPIVIGLVVCAYYVSSLASPTMRGTNALALLCSASISFFTAQTFGAVSSGGIVWPEHGGSLAGATDILAADYSTVLKTGCIYTASSSNYVTQVVLIFVGFFIVPILFPLGVALPGRLKMHLSGVINLVGTLSNFVFFPMAATAMRPLICYDHPNGKRSVLSTPEIICGSEEHTPLLISSIALLMFIASLTAFYVYMTMKMPTLKDINMCKFIINRFSHEAFWWGGIMLPRGLALTFAPVIFPNDANLEAVMVSFTLLVYAIALGKIWPWKVPAANLLEAIACTGIAFFTLIGSMAENSSSKASYDTLLVIIWICVYVLCIGMTTLSIVGLIRFGSTAQVCGPLLLMATPDTKKLTDSLGPVGAVWQSMGETRFINAFEEMLSYDVVLIQKCVKLTSKYFNPKADEKTDEVQPDKVKSDQIISQTVV